MEPIEIETGGARVVAGQGPRIQVEIQFSYADSEGVSVEEVSVKDNTVILRANVDHSKYDVDAELPTEPTPVQIAAHLGARSADYGLDEMVEWWNLWGTAAGLTLIDVEDGSVI